MSASPKDVARDYYASYAGEDMAKSFELYIAEDVQNHTMGGAYDRQAWQDAEQELFVVFEGTSMEILDQFEEGDKAVTRWRVRGTQREEFLGLPASGVEATLTGISIDRVRDGKIVEHWAEFDLHGFIEQMKGEAGDG
jgi:predicted ester cyclase